MSTTRLSIYEAANQAVKNESVSISVAEIDAYRTKFITASASKKPKSFTTKTAKSGN